MKVSTILDHIDSGHIALPEFQRGYVWNREQVRGLFDSLYRRYPVGSLLVWATESKSAKHRGEGHLAAGIIKLLLDGQQRITSLYGVIRGKAPKFFDGDARAFTGLYFHLEDELFQFYQPIKMKDDPLWVSVTELMKQGFGAIGNLSAKFKDYPEFTERYETYASRVAQIIGIQDIDFHIAEVTGEDKTIDVVVDIFNKVNSGGTTLSKGDLALAKISAEWPDARDLMDEKLTQWEQANFTFTRDWFLRSVNTLVTGEAKFSYLHDVSAEDIYGGFKKAFAHIDTCLNIISGRLGLDHDRVFFGRYAIPVLVRFLEEQKGNLDVAQRDKMLFWYAQAGMWGRFSSSTESKIDEDLEVLKGSNYDIDALIKALLLSRGNLSVRAEHFDSWSRRARFYPVLYMLTRMGEARDWGNGLPLKANLLGKMSSLELHHIFPRSVLYKAGYGKAEVNSLANFCFLTKDTNLRISNRLPEDYFPEIEKNHPGALESQWIPLDSELWSIDRYPEFLKARRELLAKETNQLFESLLHDSRHLLGQEKEQPTDTQAEPSQTETEVEDSELRKINAWVVEQGLSAGELNYDFVAPHNNEQTTVFDLAWPDGLQVGLTTPVAIVSDPNGLVSASKAGYRSFTSLQDFRDYVEREILFDEA